MTTEHPIEDEVTQLARRVERARGRLAYQFDPALTEALSEDELHAERELAERIRDQDRSQRWKEVQAAAAASDRARQTTEEIEKADMRDLLLARKAIAAQRRESSPHAKLASLYRHRSWSLRALAAVVGAGMLWSAVNVQQNIAPTGPSDPLYWFSYLLEAMISVCLIIIMIGTNKVAEWGVIDNRKQVAAAEFALLALTVSLNTYPYVRAGDWYDAAVHAVAPVMIGVALLIHDAVSARYGLAIAKATEQIRELPDPAEQIRRTLPRVATHRLSSAANAAQGVPRPEDVRESTPTGSAAETAPAAETNPSAGTPRESTRRTSAFRAERRSKTESLSTLSLETEELFSSSNGSAGSTIDQPSRSKPELDIAAKVARELDAADPGITEVFDTKRKSVEGKKGSEAQSGSTGAGSKNGATEGKNGKDKKGSSDGDADTVKDVVRSPDIYNTDQFRVADILEQELAELQAERRRARTTRQRTVAGG
ncbi:hypothetical protein [Nocardia donostiensis]|uniref:Uncharacterized protein n=1 Tax=Nocardia donostiensis TaxID=1538463 RepID=A0A1V2TH13_9NOCA|nr:hypothetical protein [Nocardia donostiensis]ONM48799.1 hypothetical protein B0T46_09910 [Nocardia donostiensis]OQS22946.1 hypothetical protein B0T44_04555 [Nocardia donostiensis]